MAQLTFYDAINEIRRLLDLLPDVRVLNEHWSSGRADQVLDIADHASLLTIARCAWEACVPLKVETPDCYDPLPPAHDELRYVIGFSREMGCVRAFGGQLVKELLGRGLIEVSEASALTAKFEESPRS